MPCAGSGSPSFRGAPVILMRAEDVILMRAERAEDLLWPAVGVFSTVLAEGELELIDRENARKPHAKKAANLPSAFKRSSPSRARTNVFTRRSGGFSWHPERL